MSTSTVTHTETKTDEKIKHYPRYKVFCHNDNKTTMAFVVYVLQTFFGMDKTRAAVVMLKVHEEGIALVGTYTMEQAEFLIDQVHSLARANKFPLKLTMEPE
jgi:ATP-dependent Clp protease adaptor protein ClpS